jgi:tRNA nucleotidyltransferase/poly(A) polymerase
MTSHHCVLPITEISHNTVLPPTLQQNIPNAECTILSFILRYLERQQVAAPLLIVGGYVRDLLLGKVPDDLDLAICLAECSEQINVSLLVDGMPAFALEHPEYLVKEIRVTTILSDESKAKQLDTAKCNFDVIVDTVAGTVKRIEVDIMPTIGEEIYSEHSRVPVRNERGTIVEDTLRRDLTIGALLLEVQHRTSTSNTPTNPQTTNFNHTLTMRMLDHYGGVKDLDRGILRSPVPHSNTLASVGLEERVLYSVAPEGGGSRPNDITLGSALGIVGRGDGDLLTQQKLWWIKVLRDDPLRTLRCLRFAAKFNFEIHTSFWSAVPFSENVLRNKVAGNRKLQEMLKIAKMKSNGNALCRFFTSIFSHRYLTYNGLHRVLAPDVLGGVPTPDTKSTFIDAHGVCALPAVSSFDTERFAYVCQHMSPFSDATKDTVASCSSDENLGAYLAAAVACAQFEAMSSAGETKLVSQQQAATTTAVLAPTDLVECCCDGLASSKATRTTGVGILAAYSELRAHLLLDSTANEKQTLTSSFAKSAEMSSWSFNLYLLVHKYGSLSKRSLVEDLKMESIMSLLETSSLTNASLVREKYTQLLSSGCLVISGKALADIPLVPRHLYSQVLQRIKVLIMLKGGWQINESGGGKSTTPAVVLNNLTPWFNANAPDLVESLDNILYENDSVTQTRTLKSIYAPQRKNGSQKKKKKKKQRIK